jgi:cellulose synthase/poly-beta-1,6-N-acetylglucosamine synthase-like glycosyltransferase
MVATKRLSHPRSRLWTQIGLAIFLSLIAPTAIYATADLVFGLPLAEVVYIIIVVSISLTATLIWVEQLLAFRPVDLPPPLSSGRAEPDATAIIAAYLPNEADQLLEVIEAFRRIPYPATLQIILAYTTPAPMAIEEKLKEIGLRDPRFLPLNIPARNKAEAVNVALGQVVGEFVGVFDADHLPHADAFVRAWRWLAAGYDAVQGRATVRNAHESWVARLVAVEFESIYGVSHPGRTRLHGFGLFGGSNGYWNTRVLRGLQLRPALLTEDIDLSIRALSAGHRIATDPHLISSELAPTRLAALWNQRLRWAQGWFQVALQDTSAAVRSPRVRLRQKLGVVHLLPWREAYSWIALQVLPVIAVISAKYGGPHRLNWFVPLFVASTILAWSAWVLQAFCAWQLAVPDLRRRGGWFVWFWMVSFVFYTHFKHLVTVVAQMKELMRETEWKITPRSLQSPGIER